jgi:hypothetical protein
MALEYRFGRMEPSMRGNGRITKLTERGNSGTLTEITSKAIGEMIKLMAMVCTSTPMEPNTRGIGRKIYRMALELKPGISF